VPHHSQRPVGRHRHQPRHRHRAPRPALTPAALTASLPAALTASFPAASPPAGLTAPPPAGLTTSPPAGLAAPPPVLLAAAFPRAGKRGRTLSLSAALGAVLIVGVAGGSAAAAATHHASKGLPATESAAAASGLVPAPGTAPDRELPGTAPDRELPDAAPDRELPGTNPDRELPDADSDSDLPGTDAGRELADAPWSPPALPLVEAAHGVQQKVRPQPPRVTAASAGAAWVDPNPTARVTSCFGMRWGRMHEGVDLAAPDGAPIGAAGAGVVVRAGVAEGYGNAVLIDHGDGFLTHYGHLSAITVTVGQRVAAGQQIGNEGSTGHSTGPHLHFEVHEGFYQNPIEPTGWMHEHGVDIPGCVPLPAGSASLRGDRH